MEHEKEEADSEYEERDRNIDFSYWVCFIWFWYLGERVPTKFYLQFKGKSMGSNVFEWVWEIIITIKSLIIMLLWVIGF